MSYRPYPNRGRAEKYATRHGKPSGWARPFRIRRKRFSLEPLLVGAVRPPDEEDRMRRLVAGLPDWQGTLTAWFPPGPVSGEETSG